MSLKAKIEAVIYAAEEPVTLAQLTSLLGHEGQAELDRQSAAQQVLPLAGERVAEDASGIPLPSEPEVLNDEILAMREELELADEQELLAAEEAASAEGAAAADAGATSSAAISREEPVGSGSAGDSRIEGASEDPAPPETPDIAEAVAAANEATTSPVAVDERQQAREAKERERALREYFRRVLDELMRDYSVGDRGLEIREVANGFRMATKPEYHDAVRGFAKSLKPPLKLSLQALETLAVVAYKQPVTSPEVSEIRGVDSGGVLGSLMARKLVTTAGRKQVIGRPILYKTTKDFLLRFGLKDIGELPSIEEFEKMAGELAEQEEIAMEGAGGMRGEAMADATLPEGQDATEPQADGDSDPLDRMPVDGRLSGPPAAEQAPADSPAGDAAIQGDERNNQRKE